MPRTATRRRSDQQTAVQLLLAALATFTEDLTSMEARVAGIDSPIERLKAIHEAAATLGLARNAFADAKGLACLEANEAGLSYPQIASALSCSEPYVQQMVYRGRRVRTG